MTVRVTAATAQRVLWQIRHDPRTVALLLVVPCFLLVLLRYVFDGRQRVFQQIGAPLCGLFPFIVMFLVTSITMLRERTTGTLERLMTLPLAKLDLLTGYAIAFGLLAALQAATVCVVGFALLGLRAPHGAASSHCSRSPTRASWSQKMTADPVDLAALQQLTRARDHRMFAGRLDKHALTRPQRAALAVVNGLEGDFRDWAAIDQWAASIAETVGESRRRPAHRESA
jgi:hypothetical protein